MFRKSDVRWLVQEAEKHPETAPEIIGELARRLEELDAENERLRDEAIRLEQRGAPAAEVDGLRRKVAELQGLLDGGAAGGPSVVLLTGRAHAARVGLAQALDLARREQALPGRPGGGPCSLLVAHPREDLLLLTSRARAFKHPCSAIPPAGEAGWPAIERMELGEGERLSAAVAVAEPPRFWTVVTRRGHVRPLLHVDLDRRAGRGEQVVESPFHNDRPVALVPGDRGDLLVVTHWGKGVRFPQVAIAGEGSTALEMEPDDEVAAALALPADAEVLLVTAAGFVARLDTARLKGRATPGGAGKDLVQAFDLLAALPWEQERRLLLLTYSGRLTFAPLDDAPLLTRVGKGVQACPLDRDPAVAVIWI